MEHTHVEQVRDYYERNTRVFLAWGRDGQTHTIHRAVWAAGVTTEEQALTYINRQIADQVSEYYTEHKPGLVRVLDLGCGVGGTLSQLARQPGLPIQGVGISISPAQIRLARRYALEQGLADRCTFLDGNYMQLGFQPCFDAAIAIESLIHAPDLAEVFRQIAAVLKPGGQLLICDDLLLDHPPAIAGGVDTRLLLAAFRRGWHAFGAATISDLVAMAAAAGFRLRIQRNLTPDLRLLVLPNLLVNMLLQIGMLLPRSWTVTQSLIGGLALQHGLRHGVIGYQWLVFELV